MIRDLARRPHVPTPREDSAWQGHPRARTSMTMFSHAELEAIARSVGVPPSTVDGDEATAGTAADRSQHSGRLVGTRPRRHPAEPAPRRLPGTHRQPSRPRRYRSSGSNQESDCSSVRRRRSRGAFYRDPRLQTRVSSEQFGDLLHDHYVVRDSHREDAIPLSLPLRPSGNYRSPAATRCSTASSSPSSRCPEATARIQHNATRSFYELFNDETELSLLDRQALRIARGLRRRAGNRTHQSARRPQPR